MTQIVVHADLALWAVSWTLQRLPALIHDLDLDLTWCADRERPDLAGGPVGVGEVHVIFRDDSGPRRDLVLKDAALGVTVLGHSSADPTALGAVAERLVGLIVALAPVDPASPVADVPDVNGPYTVPSGNDEARYYAALQLTLVGSAL